MDDASNLSPIGLQESQRRFGRYDVHQATLGDVAPLEVVRAKPVADDDVRALFIEGRGDVGADESSAAGDHIHVAPPTLRMADGALINSTTVNPGELLGMAFPLSGPGIFGLGNGTWTAD